MASAPKQTLTESETSGLQQFTDSAGRTAYSDPTTGAVYADKYNLSASSVDAWNQRQINKYGNSGPSTTSELSSNLDQYQNNLFQTYTAPEIKMPDIAIPTMEQIKTAVTPTTPAPEAINRVDTRAALTSEYGVSDLEASLADLKSQEADLVASLRQQTAGERGKPVATNVIAGRVGEAERAAAERLDVITRQKNSVVDELNTKYSIINTYMQDMTLDYNDAVARYDKEFANNMSMYSVILGQQQFAISTSLDVQKANISNAMQTAQLNEQVKSRQEAAARSNLQILVNAVTAGNLTYSSMSNDTKLMVTKLEIQSGLPVGTISSLQMSAKDSILFTNTNEGVTQVGIRGADGNISVQSFGTSTKQPTQAQNDQNVRSQVLTNLDSLKGTDGYVSNETFVDARNWYISQGGKADDFNQNYAQFINPKYYSAYGVSEAVVNPDAFK
jgi:hypothetical protein